MKAKIMIIEDEINICNFVSTTLQAHHYETCKFLKGKKALDYLQTNTIDLILLDLGLPDMDGIDILKYVKAHTTIPIIIISARTDELQKVEALDLGADDYITKPFGTEELLARIRTTFRHFDHLNPSHYHCKELLIDFDKRRITLDGKDIHLTQIEYKLVSLLAKNAGKVLTYDFIIKQIWGPYAPDDNQILRVNMANIRRKLEMNPADPQYIFTEVGVGYRMAEPQ